MGSAPSTSLLRSCSRIDYDVWGNITASTNLAFQPFGFAGGLRDDATGVVRFGLRDYDPLVGRWTGKDPIGFSGKDWNLFRYAGSDPVNFVDPNGTSAALWIASLGVGAGLVVVIWSPMLDKACKAGLGKNYRAPDVTDLEKYEQQREDIQNTVLRAKASAKGAEVGTAGDGPIQAIFTYVNSKFGPSVPLTEDK